MKSHFLFLLTLSLLAVITAQPHASLAQRPLPHEEEVSSKYREALKAAQDEKDPSDQLKKAIDLVTPALKKQNSALSVPRSKSALPIPGAPKKKNPAQESKRVPVPRAENSNTESSDIRVPSDFPSLLVFEKGKPVEVQVHPSGEPPAQLEFAPKTDRK